MAWLALVINHSIDLLGHLNAYLKSWRKNDKSDQLEDQESPETQKKAPEEEKTEEDCEWSVHVDLVNANTQNQPTV